MGRPSKLPAIVQELKSKTARARGLTQIELQDRCKLSGSCINRNIHILHTEGKVYICGWQTENVGGPLGGHYQARYKLGTGKEDVPKPPCLTRAEVSRRFNERAHKNGAIEDRRAYNRAYWWRKQPPRRDPLAAALFGSPAQG